MPPPSAAGGRLQRRDHQRVVHLGVDEGDLEAVVHQAVGELHERRDVALARHRQHHDMSLGHCSLFLDLPHAASRQLLEAL
jgi:hypothetical protein